MLARDSSALAPILAFGNYFLDGSARFFCVGLPITAACTTPFALKLFDLIRRKPFAERPLAVAGDNQVTYQLTPLFEGNEKAICRIAHCELNAGTRQGARDLSRRHRAVADFELLEGSRHCFNLLQ
jgi:hypothetical protein